MRVLIMGAKGQLAKEFIKTLSNLNIDFLALSKEELNITDTEKVFEVFESFKPTVVINCAAYNLVDRAESHSEEAIRVNSFGVANLVFACKKYNAKLVHYSTDYIFRTSWVYGEGKQNFLYKLTEWAKTQEYLRVACDEFSVPTSTRTIVEVTLKAIDRGLTGLYHLVNSGYTSRFEWAREFFRLKGIKKFIYPAYQQDFNLPAKRPRFSAMSNDKICKELGIEIRELREKMEEIVHARRI